MKLFNDKRYNIVKHDVLFSSDISPIVIAVVVSAVSITMTILLMICIFWNKNRYISSIYCLHTHLLNDVAWLKY